MPQLPESLCLNLPNPFTGYIKLLTDFLKRMISIHINTESHSKHLRFPGGQT